MWASIGWRIVGVEMRVEDVGRHHHIAHPRRMMFRKGSSSTRTTCPSRPRSPGASRPSSCHGRGKCLSVVSTPYSWCALITSREWAVTMSGSAEKLRSYLPMIGLSGLM